MKKIRSIGFKWLLSIVIAGLVTPALPAKAADIQFSDVDAQKNGWAVGSIYLMAQKQVLTGYPDGTFRPNQTISKAEWTTMVYRLFDKYRPNLYATGKLKVDGFADVSQEHWAYKQITEIYSQSFNWGVYGLNDRGMLTFHPDMQLTRMHLANMMYTFFDTRLIDRRMSPNDVCAVVADFKDVPSKFYANKNDYEAASKAGDRLDASAAVLTGSNEVLPILFTGTGKSDCSFGTDDASKAQASSLASLQASGIMTANEQGYFRPLDKVTRAEAVTILNRIYNYLKKNSWLGDYTTIELDQKGTGGSAGSGTIGGPGSGSNGIYNPDTTPSYPDREPGSDDYYGPGWSNDSVINVTDYFDDKGVLVKDLKKGEIEAALQPKNNRYMLVDLKTQEKVDLYVILDGKIAHLKQVELPKVIPVDGVELVGFRTSQRSPNPLKVGGTTATLTVQLSKEQMEIPKPGKKK